MWQSIVYLDRSTIRPGATDDVTAALAELVAFVEEREPRMVSYGFFIDRDALEMTVVAVHPDSASLELHLQLGGPGFRKVGQFITLRTIEVFGQPSEAALAMLHAKAAMLGTDAPVVVHPLEVGFSRVELSRK